MNPTHALVQRETIRLRPFVGALLADFEIRARARHVTLDALVFLDEISGDGPLLRSLLACLVGDALKRAPAGTHVSVVVSPRERYAEFRVADEGAGIAAEVRDKAFDAEARGLRSASSGLTRCGLAAEAQGGWLSVTENNDGTVVCLSFPREVGNTAAIEPPVEVATPREMARTKPRLIRPESGIYVRADVAFAPTNTRRG